MYDPELQFFLADYRRIKCNGMPFLCYAVNHIFETYYDANGAQDANTPINQQTEDGEWVDIDDNSDDEVQFQIPHRRTQLIGDTLNDTLPLDPTTRQVDEYQDQMGDFPTTDEVEIIDPLNVMQYFSADEDDLLDNR